MADRVLFDAVGGITELIQTPGEINVDFADVRTIMSCSGPALMGTGWGEGERRAIEAAERAISSPLLEDVGVEGASGILINITGGPDLRLVEVSEAAALIEDAAHEDANIIYGQVIDPGMTDKVKITVIATGFQPDPNRQTKTDTARAETGRRSSVPSQVPTSYSATERPLQRALSRRPEAAEPAPARAEVMSRVQSMFTDAEIDIPTFIRKQTE
jgi:cell division protein FtsZ